MDSIARQLSRFAVNLRFEDLPEEAVRYTKQLVLDTLGCALGGYLSEPSQIARRVIGELGGKGECTVIGSGVMTSCPNATLTNGIMVRYLDFNDSYMSIGGSHPSDNIPSALAVAEREHVGGREAIVAVVLGYEVQGRFVDTSRFPGYHHATMGGFAVPVIAGKLLGLNEEEMTNAIGIGGSHNVTLAGIYGEAWSLYAKAVDEVGNNGAPTGNPGEESQINLIKAAAYPFAAQSGVMAALLARRGFTGPSTIIESFLKISVGDIDTTALTQGRERLRILDSQLKPYAAGYWTHTPVASALKLVRENNLKAEDIDLVQISGIRGATVALAGEKAYKPTSKESADHSTPYAVAIAILEGDVGPDQYARQQWLDPRVLDLMSRIKCTFDPELDKFWAERRARTVNVEIRTRSGNSYSCLMDYPKGDTKNPMTQEEVEAKFRNLASKVMAEAQIRQVIRAVDGLEEVEDIGQLMELLVV
ncbi:MAG: MmgE/PrpD family protein [Chloroflexi bacterium]|nr:MmgE/PrpD family protein [Chloroflexota bacterium]